MRRRTVPRPAGPVPPRSRMRGLDAWPLAVLGLASRPARAILSAIGVALGIATMVAVLGISDSSRAQLVAEIDALGTNLLTVTPGQSFSGQNATLSASAPAMVSRIGPVIAASAIGDVNASVYRNDRISAANTNAITVYAAQTNLLATLQGRLADGTFLNAATARYPAVILGTDAASALGINRADGSVLVWLGSHWFSVAGILDRLPLAPELDRSALIGYPAAERLLHSRGSPAEIYVRTNPASVAAVQAVLSVLERRGEIGLRRALGARRAHIAAQFVTEAALLAASGGAAGAVLGGFTTTVYAAERHWSAVVPVTVLLAAVALALAIGVLAGLYPALRAARLAPAEALRII